MSMKEDLKNYPVYLFENYELKRIEPPQWWNRYEMQMHHFIKAQRMRYKEFEKIKHLQKLILMPTQMHLDIHSHIRNFEDKWGVSLDEVLYRGE